MSSSSGGVPSTLFFLRHGARLDQFDTEWHLTSPTPYDPPLTAKGIQQARQTGLAIKAALPFHTLLNTNTFASGQANTGKTRRIIIHTSPFLRCIQTALTLAAALDERVLIRVDAWLGEWLTPDYYTDIDPPPPSRQLCSAAVASLSGRTSGIVQVDWMWDSLQLGEGGEYGEQWAAMHQRLSRGLTGLLSYYETEGRTGSVRTEVGGSTMAMGENVVILVTHGAGCNALLGALTQKPVLIDIPICSLSMAVLRPPSPSSLSSTSTRDYDLILQADTKHLLPPNPPPLLQPSSPQLHNRTSSFTAGIRPVIQDKRIIEYHPIRSRSATTFPPVDPPPSKQRSAGQPVNHHPSLKLRTTQGLFAGGGAASPTKSDMPSRTGLWTPTSPSTTTVSDDEIAEYEQPVELDGAAGRRRRVVGLWRSWAAGETLDSGVGPARNRVGSGD